MIPDILKLKTDDKDAEPGETYNFSDGCGSISQDLSDLIASKHDLY